MSRAYSTLNIGFLSILIAVFYILAGHISLLFSTPPSNASVIWLPSGIALTAALLTGYRAAAGIFLGAFLVHMTAFLDASSSEKIIDSLIFAVITSAGSLLQAYSGRYLITRYVKQPYVIIHIKDIVLFMLYGGPVACLVAASIASITFYLMNAIALSSIPIFWGTWWVGDTIGVVILTPILLSILLRKQDIWNKRIKIVSFPLVFLLAIIISFFYYTNRHEIKDIENNFKQNAAQISQTIEKALIDRKEEVLWISNAIKFTESKSSLPVNNDYLKYLTEHDMHENEDITGFYWVTLPEALDENISVSSNIRLHIKNCSCALPGKEYFNTLSRTDFNWSFKFLSSDNKSDLCSYILMFSPTHNFEGKLKGFTGLKIDVKTLFSNLLSNNSQLSNIDFTVTDKKSDSLLFEKNPSSNSHKIHDQSISPYVHSIKHGKNSLLLTFTPNPSYISAGFSWSVWFVLAGGLLFAAISGIGLLILSGRTIQTENIVAERTRELANEIRERSHTQKLLKLQNDILEMIAKAEPLKSILNKICVDFEKHSPAGTVASVMLVDENDALLHITSAPDLSPVVYEAMLNFPIGEGEASCGTAVARCEQVIVDDIKTSPLWEKYRDFAMTQGLHACWSTPFFSRKGKVLGSFALTHPVPRKPTMEDRDRIGIATFLTGLAIEQDRNNADLNKLSMAVDQSPSVVIMTDTKGNIDYVNKKFNELTLYSDEEAIGSLVSDLLKLDISSSEYEHLWKTVLSGNEWRGSMLNTRKDGTQYWAQYYISPIRNYANEITQILGIHEDITEIKRSSEKITYQATHDQLTGLINRSEFEVRLQRSLDLARSDNSIHTLCFLDLDQFKIINDTCGHIAGDELLRQIGNLMKKTIRKHDTVARVGGDEFGIILENCEIKQSTQNIELLRQAVEDFRFNWDGKFFQVGVSIGMVEISQQSPSELELLREVDAACYAAKEQGRNRIHIYNANDEMTARHSSEIRWVNEIANALNENRFILYQQSIVALEDRNSHSKSLEILVRMVSIEGEVIAPGDFLPAAERYNLATKIDEWVVRNTIRMLSEKSTLMKEIDFCSINLSALSLELKFAEHIMTWLDEYEINPEVICLEITETAAIRNLVHAQIFIDALKSKGVRFALDDFGSGLSSFGYLKNLPVNFLKIDGQFVKDITQDPIDLAMVKSINDIANVMGKITIAEFVETKEILDELQHIGIDYAQGYYLQKPQPF